MCHAILHDRAYSYPFHMILSIFTYMVQLTAALQICCCCGCNNISMLLWQQRNWTNWTELTESPPRVHSGVYMDICMLQLLQHIYCCGIASPDPSSIYTQSFLFSYTHTLPIRITYSRLILDTALTPSKSHRNLNFHKVLRFPHDSTQVLGNAAWICWMCYRDVTAMLPRCYRGIDSPP